MDLRLDFCLFYDWLSVSLIVGPKNNLYDSYRVLRFMSKFSCFCSLNHFFQYINFISTDIGFHQKKMKMTKRKKKRKKKKKKMISNVLSISGKVRSFPKENLRIHKVSDILMSVKCIISPS